MFIPMGFYLPLYFKNINNYQKTIKYSLFVILIIEVGQFVLRAGVFDVDDIILNTLGCLIGYTVCRWYNKICKKG